MDPVTYAIPDFVPCRSCREDTPVNSTKCPSCGVMELRLDIGDFLGRIHKRQVMDIRHGGLVLGRPGTEDDIPMFDIAADNVLSLTGMMQGMEFIVCPEATVKHMGILTQLNEDKGDPSTLDEPDWFQFGNVFDTNSCMPLEGLWPHGGVWVGSQFVLNRYATKKHFLQLVNINRDK